MSNTLTTSPAWQALKYHRRNVKRMPMREMFFIDPSRHDRFSLEACGILFDYSKNIITRQTIDLLVQLATQAKLKHKITGLFQGEKLNFTEHRAALHTLLRDPQKSALRVDGIDARKAVHQVLDKMEAFVKTVHEGEWLGYTGKRITDIVNIGIGGSDLGPALVISALNPYAMPGIRSQFAYTIDPRAINAVLEGVDAETTLFVVVSKTFTTQETLANANAARSWLVAKLGSEQAVAKHFIAISTNAAAVEQFGIAPANMFVFWDWVGGRYSLWSAVGMSIALSIGMARFRELLAGAHAMDRHFRETPFSQNMPVIMALLSVWYANFFDARTHAILPYDLRLSRLAAFIQQLAMESNGKAITTQGLPVEYATSPVYWGGLGNCGQHAYFQLLHQGTHLIPADFIAVAEPPDANARMHDLLLANCLAQMEALMRGKTAEEARAEMKAQGLSAKETKALLPHKLFPGNRPSNMMLLRRLDPHTLGALLAAYEHKTFVEGMVWDINPFDQWGVEYGKQLTKIVEEDLSTPTPSTKHDCSTNGLINAYKRMRDQTAGQ
ncbi:MAG: glucose-6-phosphate isomerase [Thiobacillaceae bacterium]